MSEANVVVVVVTKLVAHDLEKEIEFRSRFTSISGFKFKTKLTNLICNKQREI